MTTLATNAPLVPDVMAYLTAAGLDVSDTTAVMTAMGAEMRDQANRLRFPTDTIGDPTYDEALTEALYRRIAHNLAVRKLPLGLQAAITDGAVATNVVGGTDAEVRRLEAPYRRRSVG